MLGEVGARADIVNPFTRMTKGEMFAAASARIGPDAASSLLSATHSCALTGQRSFGIPVERSCGVCFGCVLRRASFAASGIDDRTTYIDPGDDQGLRRWLEGKSVEQPVRNFVRRGVGATDLVAAALPLSFPLRAALELCERGVAELRSLYG